MKNVQSHTLLESLMNNHKELGSTYTEKSIGTTIIFTIDPQNLQTYHRTNFRDYGVHRLRKKAFCPLLGDGVFSTDGSFWEHSRALIRPTFTRVNVANFPAFEIHLQKFLKLIPRDGRTVNLSPLLDDLFLDTSTEFIFGESVKALDKSSDEASESHKFLNSFNHA
ncbi:putative cytochrome p450 alkane hydroxylase protein [Botrytis fragariae]|uniref:Putative cytochrome p450 alkane hydroxylase protein n=1 Tax=Botrytis fragariae TaxID=1964551 RepID=A0A8H6AYN1_9HELO|nr:putative cytochrome p450 alkane hydroxylase protein [Botrytis fragariae]KAF5875845.1 putative cytochrome p450 alkane hydroxylase protein [Botrytis fragariae]